MQSPQTPEKYFPYFDYLRIALASIVMLGHDRIIGWPNSGDFAVQVFFALSGWLIGNILLRMNPHDLPHFYFNRAIRIWVPYYLALAFLLGAAILKDPITAKWLEFALYKATFVYNIFGPPQLATAVTEMPLDGTGNHFWSVNAEEQFYLLSPLLLVLLPPRIGKSVITWIVIAALAWWQNVYASIVFGVLAAVTVFRYGSFELTWPGRIALAIVGASASIALYFGVLEYAKAVPILSLSIVLLLAIPGKPSKIGKFLGGMSYPLYLNHWIGVFVANALLAPFGLRDSPPRQLLATVVSLLLAAGLYRFIEKPLLAMRPALYSPKAGKALMITGYAMVIVGVAVGLVCFGIP